MKNLILIAVCFLVTSLCQSQTFTLSTEVGQGFKFKDYNNPQFYLVNSTVKPAASLLDGKMNASAIVMGAFSDGYTYVFGGTGLDYAVLTKNEFSISVGATALFGSEARSLYGLNTTINLDKSFYLTLNARQEYSQKEFWFDGGAGFRIF